MSGGDIKINPIRRRFAARVLFLVSFVCVGFLLSSESPATDQILNLTATKDHYFLGPYLYYLEDSQKNLTISDVSSPQMGARFVRHTEKLLNLGLNSYAYWIRFTVFPSETLKKWLLFFGWPNVIDEATLYIPKIDSPGWSVEQVGRVLPTGPDPLSSRPADFLPDSRSIQPLTFYLRVESAEVKQIPLQILTAESYQRRSRLRLLGFGVYYGIMLAMFLYNLILIISLRELNRLYYLLYLLSMGLIYFVGNGLWWEFFSPGSRLNRTLGLIFICFAFFWGNFFAKSFLITRKNAPFFDKLLSVFMVYSIILVAMIPLVDRFWITFAVLSQSILIPPVFLLAGIASWNRGFRPARFFLIAFAILALSVIFEALVTFGLLPYLTLYSSQIGSAIEVILLQLALADRIKTLSQEQDRIKHSLSLAREVQQSLLPHKSPKMDRLDIAGKSIYCDETGGDYYDYIYGGQGKNKKISVAIGDVAGHGISSALLMATVRSYLRQRASLTGSVASIISDVNHQLVQDVEDSGQFMTMFYMTIDPKSMKAHWVRAGHDPAIFYDPCSDTFEELGGTGIALGVDEDWSYKTYEKAGLVNGQIIFLSTDGIWEAFNPKGEMFGKERIYDIIRKNSVLGAEEIVQKTFAALNNFQQGAPIEDDITLVIIKITD
jgi:serine phosphatase RsbU (regulator of sigma subunit)